VRHEALLDLMALSEVNPFGARDVAHVTRLACSPETPATLAPGLVVLLAAIRAPESGPALVSVMKRAASPQVRARAARVVGARRDPQSVPALREALRDPALEVRLTAQRALEQIDAVQRRS
jgi:HEAT repeat protein